MTTNTRVLPVTELTAADAGRIIAALEHFADGHPQADVLLDLADRIATCTVRSWVVNPDQ